MTGLAVVERDGAWELSFVACAFDPGVEGFTVRIVTYCLSIIKD